MRHALSPQMMEPCSLVAMELACRRGERILFRGLSLALGPGGALHLAGPNGSGKSSLMRILAGLMKPFAGSVTSSGAIALIDERPALDEHLPLAGALAFWAGIDGAPASGGSDRGANPDRGPAAWGPAALGLAPLADIPVRYLSTGQRKRAAMARLIGQGAAIWLLDEPLNGLDLHAAALVQQLVEDHCRTGGLAVIASHQDFALARMDRIMLADWAD